MLKGGIPSLNNITSARIWPITVNDNHATNILKYVGFDEINLGKFSASSLTGLIAFELETSHPDVAARFVLNLPLHNIPEERTASIIQT